MGNILESRQPQRMADWQKIYKITLTIIPSCGVGGPYSNFIVQRNQAAVKTVWFQQMVLILPKSLSPAGSRAAQHKRLKPKPGISWFWSYLHCPAHAVRWMTTQTHGTSNRAARAEAKSQQETSRPWRDCWNKCGSLLPAILWRKVRAHGEHESQSSFFK